MDLRGLTELVGYEGASIWLYRRLRASSTLGALPVELGERLREQAVEAAALRLRVEEVVAEVAGLFASRAIPVILIKGAARGALAHRYPWLDARATRDVDLLLPEDRIQGAYQLLLDSGYAPTRAHVGPPRIHHHLPAVWNERQVAVELHQSTSMRVPPAVAWSRANDRAEEVEWAGQRVRVPDATEMAWSAIAHGTADAARGFRLDRFLEVAALVADGAPVDWTVVSDRSRSTEAVGPGIPPGDANAVVLGWLAAALALGSRADPPATLGRPAFNLRGLLEWRLAILRTRSRLGRGFAERLLQEGPRALIGLPVQSSPAEASWSNRVRRRVAGHASRMMFRAWRATRRGPEPGCSWQRR